MHKAIIQAVIPAMLFILPSLPLTGAASQPTKSSETTMEDIAMLKRISRGFSHVAEKSLNAVVSIKVVSCEVDTPSSSAPYEEEFFRRFFGVPGFPGFPGLPGSEQPLQKRTKLGSGVLISPDGYIATNNHVIANTEEIEVTTHDDVTYRAKLIGTDPDTDLAVIKIESETPLPHLAFGDSDALKVGEWVIAIGTPRAENFKSSLTVGVVSAKGRALELTRVSEYIQTDAAINLGNSGGPLLNVDGEIIGINNSIVSNDGTYIGIGFSIPSNIAKNVTTQLIEHGRVRRGIFGFYYKPVTQEIADAYQLDRAIGIVITEVIKETPAEAAGLKFADVVTHANGEQITAPKDLNRILTLNPPGNPIRLRINREGEVVEVDITPEENREFSSVEVENDRSFGITLKQAQTPQEGERAHIEIGFVNAGSAAYRAGVRPGMQLVGINRTRPTNINDAYTLLKQAEKEQQVLLLLQDGNRSLFITIKEAKE